MKKYLLVLSILLLTIIPNSCQFQENKTTVDKATVEVHPVLIQKGMYDPRINAKWTKISDFKSDLDMDEKEDFIGLYTAAERNESGGFLWDDGQKWLMLIQSGDKFYQLFNEYVQLGSVYYTVSKYSEDSRTKVTVFITTDASLRILSYSFDKDKNGFIEEPVYSSPENNFIYSSIPNYQ